MRDQRLRDGEEIKDRFLEYRGKDKIFADRTTKFFEDLLRHVIDKVLKKETYLGDAQGKLFQKRHHVYEL